MRIEKPVVYMAIICDVCKAEIDGDEDYYTVQQVNNLGLIRTPIPLDVCCDCFRKLKPEEKPWKASYAVTSSYAITGSWKPYALSASYASSK